MDSWTIVECGFDAANETINFGTRTLAEGDALYETTTLAVVGTDNQPLSDPTVKCLNRNNKIYLLINNTFRIFSNNCTNLDVFATFECFIDSFNVSDDENLVILCLNDGNIHCLYIPSGGKVICSTVVTEKIIDKCFLSVFVYNEDHTSVKFILSTKNNSYILRINDIEKLYEDLNNEIEDLNVNFSLEQLCVNDKSSLFKTEYENKVYYVSNVYKRCIDENYDPFVLVLNSDKNLIGICKLTKVPFKIYNKELFKDIIFLRSENYQDHRIIVLTDSSTDESHVRLLSYPDFEVILDLKVSNNTYLVESYSEQDEVMFIEGVCANGSEFVSELRVKVILESNPEVKLNRYLKRKCFDEAKKFATGFGLSLQPVYKAEAEEFVMKTDFESSDFEVFCNILDNIDDIDFVVDCCLNITSNSLDGIKNLFEYADKRLYTIIQNNPDDPMILNLKNIILKTLFKLDTFKFLYYGDEISQTAQTMEKWEHFSNVNLFEEMCNYLINGKIDKCTLLFNRIQQDADISLDTTKMKNVINLIPVKIPLMDLLPFLYHIIMYSQQNLPDSVPVMMKWIYNTILNYDFTKNDDLESVLKFCNYIQSFFYTEDSQSLYLQQYNLTDGCLNLFRKMINSLTEMIILKKNFGIKINVSQYIQNPKIVAHLLLDKVMLNHIKKFVQIFLFEYCSNNKLKIDDILYDYIHTLSNNLKCYWEETVINLVPFINSNSIRMEIILHILEVADVPWSQLIEQLATDASKECHPLAEKIKIKREYTPWKILLKKYSIPERINKYDDNDVQLITRRILLVSKPEVLDDLNAVIIRHPHLKENCSVLCFNHFVQVGESEKALKYVDNLTLPVLKRCFNLVLSLIHRFIFCKHQFLDITNNYIDVLNPLLHRLEKHLPDYNYEICYNEAMKLKNIYLLKKHFNCEEEIINDDFDILALLTKLIRNIIISVEDDKIEWIEAINKCVYLSHLLGIPKEECFFELIRQSNNLEALLYSAENMIKNDSDVKDLCTMAITIMQNINSGYNTFENGNMSRNSFVMKKDSNAVKALKLIDKLALTALVKADKVEVLLPCAILNWISACYWLKDESDEAIPQWKFTPLYQPETINIPSVSTINILKEFFDMFLLVAETRFILPLEDKPKKIRNFNSLEDQLMEFVHSLPEKIQKLHVEGHDIMTFQLVNVFKKELLCSSNNEEFSNAAAQKINSILNQTCVSQLLNKIFVKTKIDQQFALSLFLQPKFEPLKWIFVAAVTYKRNVKKLSAAANLACSYMELPEMSDPSNGAYLTLKNRCTWWQKFLHKSISYNDTFQLDADKIVTEHLIKTENFNLQLLQQFCKDFSLNIQEFLPLYLRYSLLQWKPNIELVKLSESQDNLSQGNNTENGPFVKCKDIIFLMENKMAAVDQLNAVWNEISYYQYEVYLCILDLLDALDQKCLNPEKRFLLSFLKNYLRIKKPQQKEIDDWQTKYPFAREIDPLSEYRLPYLLAIHSKDIWEIIRPEINLMTYDRWFETSTILQLDRNDICTYAIKGTIYSGVFNSHDTKWSVSSKHDALLKNLEICVSKITNLEVATAALYQAVCKVSGGADQVVIAKLCWEKAIHWKKTIPRTENMNDVLIKVKRKYLNCVSMHILYTHNIGTKKYLALIENTDQLIRELYNDESIVKRTKGVIMYDPDINSVVDQLGEQLGVNIMSIRTSLILEYLEHSGKNVNFDDSFYNLNSQKTKESVENVDDINDNLKRVIYICESSKTDEWKSFLFNIAFSKLDESMSEFVTSPDLSMQIKALQCLLVISKDTKELDESIGEPASSYLEKLKILLTLESVGYSITVYELDNCVKTDLINKILRSNPSNKNVIHSVAKLLGKYRIWEATLWNMILQSFIDLGMVSDLQLWLPKLYGICYVSGVKCPYTIGWEYLINNIFAKALNRTNYVHGLRLVQICPIICKLDSCLNKIFKQYLDKNLIEICAMFLPYIINEEIKLTMLQALHAHKSKELYDKIKKLFHQGITNTDFAIAILEKYSQ